MSANKKLKQMVWAAIFAAAITVTTAYLLHIPLPTGGYVHVGDALIYLAACLLPAPWAMAAGAVGAGLADLLTAPMWVLPTVIVKAVICLPFTSKNETVFCTRNLIAVFISGLISPTLYAIANVIFTGSLAAFPPQFLGTLVQAVGSGVIFVVLAYAFDKVELKRRLSFN